MSYSGFSRFRLARTHRQLGERRTLFRMVEARRPAGEIAARLGRHLSTIHRELGRNCFRDGDRGFTLGMMKRQRRGVEREVLAGEAIRRADAQ